MLPYKMKELDVRNNSFGGTLDALMFTSRPDTKWILGLIMKL
jgi:hypothetical protein